MGRSGAVAVEHALYRLLVQLYVHFPRNWRDCCRAHVDVVLFVAGRRCLRCCGDCECIIYVIASVCCGVHLPLPVITVNPLTAARGLYTGRSEPLPLVIDARLLMLQR